MDLILYNTVGYISYSIYCVSRWFIQEKYGLVHSVTIFDVAFPLHAFCATTVIAVQCCCFDKGGQKLSVLSIIVSCVIVCLLLFACIAAEGEVIPWFEVGGDTAPTSPTQAPQASDKPDLTLTEGDLADLGFVAGDEGSEAFLLPDIKRYITAIGSFGYVKLLINCFKYLPQVLMNAQRQSTEGMSHWTYVLDLGGGITSILQNVINAMLHNDLEYILANLPKMLISATAVFYDSLILFQHFVLYAADRPAHPGVQYATVPTVVTATVDAESGVELSTSNAVIGKPASAVE